MKKPGFDRVAELLYSKLNNLLKHDQQLLVVYTYVYLVRSQVNGQAA
jgi:hypothetical protein